MDQPGSAIIRNDAVTLAEFANLLAGLNEFQELLPHMFTWEHGENQDFSFTGEEERWAERTANILGETLDDQVQFNRRFGPDWRYYRSIRLHLSILESMRTAAALEKIVSCEGGPGTELMGINRRLYVSPRVRSAVPRKAEIFARKVLTHLGGGTPPARITVIPLENRVVFSGGMHALVLERECGLVPFKAEFQRVERRHRREASVLFRAKAFDWSATPDDDRFELMIRELLMRENGVLRVRKAGHSRDADGGKDLLADWVTPRLPGTRLDDHTPPNVVRKVLVQIKDRSRSVGKNMVTDIRDTVEHHGATGYLLVVSTQITSDLTDHLDRLRTNGTFWTDWWNRQEIEDRLNTNPDIAENFSDIVQRRD
jgi:hypothetical protein